MVIKAILFDAGFTLVHPRGSFPELLAELVRERGHTIHDDAVAHAETALLGAFRSDKRASGGWTFSAESSRAFWTSLYRDVIAELGFDDDGLPDFIYERFIQPERYVLFDDVLPALLDLKARGYRLGVISNWERWLPSVLDRCGITPHLETVVVSGVVGVEKPDLKIFRMALEELDLDAAEACYVGDLPTFDVEPARKLGMRPFLIDRAGRHDADEWPVIRSLGEIAGALLATEAEPQREALLATEAEPQREALA